MEQHPRRSQPQGKGATMRTQGSQGSFINLIRTLLAKAKEVSDTAPDADVEIVPLHPRDPRAEAVANLLVLGVLSKIQERLAEENNRHGERVFRYNSSPQTQPFQQFLLSSEGSE